MKLTNIIWALIITVACQNVWAYGKSSSSSRKICDKLDLSEFTPVNNSVVAGGSEFSFRTSARINPDRIKVTVKGQPVDVKITPETIGFLVTGTLPAELTSYARISIVAEGLDKCQADAGWLVNVTE